MSEIPLTAIEAAKEELRRRGITSREDLTPEIRDEIVQVIRTQTESGTGSKTSVYTGLKRLQSETPTEGDLPAADLPIIEVVPVESVEILDIGELEDDGDEPDLPPAPTPRTGFTPPPLPDEPIAPFQPSMGLTSQQVEYMIKLGFQKLSTVSGCDGVALTEEEAYNLGVCWTPIVNEYLPEIMQTHGAMIYAVYVTGMIVVDKAIIYREWKKEQNPIKETPPPPTPEPEVPIIPEKTADEKLRMAALEKM